MVTKCRTRMMHEQIDEVANQQLELGYFQKRTANADAEEALLERIQRDDRFLIVLSPGGEIEEIHDTAALYRRDELSGFGFFGTYTKEEMERYTAVPVEDIFSPEIFPVGHLRNVTLRDDVQGESLGYVAASYALGKMYEQGHQVIVTCLWNQEGTPGTREYAEKVGAERVAEYETYFEDRICPSCDFSKECTCTFAFFKWVME